MAFKLKGLSPLPSYTLFLAFMKVSFPCLFCKNPNGFQVERVIPSPVIHTIPGFHESVISMFILYKITQFYTIKAKNVVGEDTQTPPPPHCNITYTFYKAKTIISNVFCLEKIQRDVIFIQIIVCKPVSMAKIDFDHTKAE